ncbi:PEP-CTERM sorting domain-containing protein [Roseofilum casamattae]|uniref:PEP-CTERM sorting domain-containing protein n=1 Tax=Roseofilum casamattae BLCC-M143 TaxID=3022442 RepID=A0ABT7BZJ7_9CYAN|nr:PEP-CTERM sorting domain-containing protein [Roseofilum casamattae]MDJ1184638.1 PEP-CTERM sorting domain-containing protein [Roseofilum casamattae BLCC-M143]
MFSSESWFCKATRTVKQVALGLTSVVLCWSGLNLEGRANAASFSVLWWDTTNRDDTRFTDSIRKEIPDFLDAFTVDGEDIFETTYMSHRTPGELANHLDLHTYDAIVLDTDYRSPPFPFGVEDREALKEHYKNKSNLILDGSLLIRSMDFWPQFDFPGPNNAFGHLTANQVYTLVKKGGGMMIGTDHAIHHADANFMLDAILPGAEFSGVTNPSTDGVFYGADFLNNVASVVPMDIFNHWSSMPNQGIAPTGDFIDFLGNPVTLYSQVDVADKPGGGEKYSYISTSWKPDECTTAVTGTSSACQQKVPEPSALFGLLAVGAVGSWVRRR